MKPILYRYKDTEAVIKVMDGYTPGEGWTPLFDEETMKAATDAALERAAQKVEPSRGTEAIEVIGGEDGLLMLRELAAEIRALKESKE